MYIWILSFDVDLLGIRSGCTVDAGIMDTGQHKHLIIRFFAEITELVHVHFYVTINLNL